MEFVSKVHGKIQYDENKIITFNKGLPGFEDLRKFIIVDLDEYEPFKLLHSLESDEVAIVVTSPYEFYENYEIEIKEETLKHLNIKNKSESFSIKDI